MSYNTIKSKKLMQKDSKCHWCNIETIKIKININENELPDNFATIDHIFPKLHPLRLFSSKTVLACHKCNQTRNRNFYFKLPSFIKKIYNNYKIWEFKKIKDKTSWVKKIIRNIIDREVSNLSDSKKKAIVNQIYGELFKRHKIKI